MSLPTYHLLDDWVKQRFNCHMDPIMGVEYMIQVVPGTFNFVNFKGKLLFSSVYNSFLQEFFFETYKSPLMTFLRPNFIARGKFMEGNFPWE